MTDSTTPSTDPVRVELFLRTRTPPDVVDRLRDLVARARRLETTDAVADVRVQTWAPVRPALEELSDGDPSVARTVNAFRSWADREGYSLRPAFARHERTSLLEDRPTAEITVPIVCVAVYEDDALQCVAPCADGDRTYTVPDCLEALEAGIVDPLESRPTPSRGGREPRLEDDTEPAE
ncbi:HTH domain-containing protein [Halopiger thermotolerans]